MTKQKIVVLGAGFAGLRFVKELSKNKNFDITLIDKHNYHQFQPLLYQVATSGIEPSSISFPLRKILRKHHNISVRYCEVLEIIAEKKEIITTEGNYEYDKLVIAMGANTNFFGNKILEENCLTMKSVPESLFLRNKLLENYEKAVVSEDQTIRDGYMNIVIVGGGATGVELAGSLAEMKNTVLQKDYPELDFSRMKIRLIEAGNKLLPALSEFSSAKALKYLRKLGVEVGLNSSVKSFDGTNLQVNTETILSKCVIWVAGIKANTIKGIEPEKLGRAGRIITDEFSKVSDGIYAIGDIALTDDKKYPNGHPQIAPVAVQQADNLAKNFILESNGKSLIPFYYKNRGSMATVGRNLAVVEIGKIKFGGIMAWATWMFVHLMSIVGVKNRLWVFFSWLWEYITYDVSLRLIIKQEEKKEKVSEK